MKFKFKNSLKTGNKVSLQRIYNDKMKIVYNSVIPFGGFLAINLFECCLSGDGP